MANNKKISPWENGGKKPEGWGQKNIRKSNPFQNISSDEPPENEAEHINAEEKELVSVSHAANTKSETAPKEIENKTAYSESVVNITPDGSEQTETQEADDNVSQSAALPVSSSASDITASNDIAPAINTPVKEKGKRGWIVPLLAAVIVLLLIASGVLIALLVNRNDNNSGNDEPSSSAVITTDSTTSSAKESSTTTAATSTTTASTTTTTQASPDLESYLGFWHIENVAEEELIIEAVYSDEIVFTYWVYRTMSYDMVSATINGNIAEFDTGNFKGTLKFEDDRIVMKASSHDDFLELDNTEIIFSMKIETSVVYGDGMKYFEDHTDDLIVNALDRTIFGEIVCSGMIEGMDSSYITDGGEYKTVRTNLQNGWHIRTDTEAYSHGSWWYECYDSDDGDYYGWINAGNILLNWDDEPIKPDIPEFSKDELRQIARQLYVPDNVDYVAYQDDVYYWEGTGIWIRYVSFMSNNTLIAGASVDAYTGEPLRAITAYGEYGAPFDPDTPNVWCSYCGYGFFVTGVGSNGLDCPSCGKNFMPDPGSPPD